MGRGAGGTAGYPTNVTVSMYIEGLSSFKAQTMDFHVDIYFQETWIDTRLRHKESSRVLIKVTLPSSRPPYGATKADAGRTRPS